MSNDPLLRPLEALLNRQVAASRRAVEAAEALDGRTLALRLQNTGLTLFLSVDGGRVLVSRDCPGEPDAVLGGTVLALAALARGDAVASGRLSIEGDPATARDFEALLRHARPDWEEELSRLVGDVAAHQLGTAARSFAEFGRRAMDSVGRSFAEFMQEERRDVPAPSEAEELVEDTQALVEDIEELEARVARLERARGAGDERR